MKVRYTGPSGSGVDVVHADPEAPDTNTVTHCPPGEAVDLPDDVAVGQMVAGTFEPADSKAERTLAKHHREVAAAEATEDEQPTIDEGVTAEDTPAEPGPQED